MFKSTSFAPLSAECYLDPEAPSQFDKQMEPSASTDYKNFAEISLTPRASPQGLTKTSNDSPTSTESGSDDDNVEIFQDEFHIRRLSSSEQTHFLPVQERSRSSLSSHNPYFLHYDRSSKTMENPTQIVDMLTGTQGERHGRGGSHDSRDARPEKEKQAGHDKASNTKQAHLDRQARRLIRKLLADYEEMEQMYQDEKLQHARVLEQLSNSNRAGLEDESGSQISKDKLYPPADNRPPVHVARLHDRPWATHSSSRLTNTSLAPDPPEFDGEQWHYKHRKVPAYRPSKVLMEDSSDKYSDDLSSRDASELIDGDISSECKAVKEHNEGRQYMRDIILGVNDGLVSTFLLVSGVRGGGFSSRGILLSAIAASVAGAVSMCAGEYVATKSQNELTKGEIATEERHIRDYRNDELMEVPSLLELIGIGGEDRDLLKRLIRHYARDPKALLKIMVALEFGFLQDEERSPFMAGLVSFFLFLIGAFPSVFPFMIPNIHPTEGFIVAGAATCISLLIVGAVKTWATKGNCLSSAMENLAVAGLGGAVAYGAGALTATFIEEE